MSLYLQELERRLLEVVYTHLVEKGIIENNMCVLCYDGIMVLKENVNNPDALCNELTQMILKQTGFNMKIVQKPMDRVIQNMKGAPYTPEPFHPPKLDTTNLMDIVDGNTIDENDKKQYGVTGNFEHVKGDRYRALGQWSCPQVTHSQNREVRFYKDHMYCCGCAKRFNTMHPSSSDQDWLTNTKQIIIDVLRKNKRYKNFTTSSNITRVCKDNAETYYNEFVFKIQAGAYQLEHNNQSLVFDGMGFFKWGHGKELSASP